MQLPKFKTDDRSFALLQTQWAQSINPVLSLPMVNQNTLRNNPSQVGNSGVTLAIGSNTINHLLGRALQGWFIVRQRSAANIYDDQDNNTTPALTLVLVSDAIVSVDIVVF